MSILFKHKVNWKYAVGEIVLIFIGITLAIAFNNWNDERKAYAVRNKLHHDLINSVYYDLLDEVSMISNSINRLTLQKDLSLMILKSIESQDYKSVDSTRLWNAINGNLTPTILINRNRNTWDEIVTSDKLELLDSKVMTQLLSEYYREYDYLITHFNQLPHKAREALREIVGGNATWSEIESVSKETVLIPYSDKSNHRLGEWLNESEFPKLISKIAVSSHNFTRWLSELISQAQSIISYMEENYPDILNED